MFTYRPDVLRELERHGVQPKAHTRPELVRDFVRELYKFEIRTLRAQLLRGEFPKGEYAWRVEALRRRYPVLSLQSADFVVGTPAEAADHSPRSNRT